MSLELRVDRSLCEGSATCVRRAPELFSVDAEGKAVAGQPGEAQRALALEAAGACPFFAIEVWEGGERVD